MNRLKALTAENKGKILTTAVILIVLIIVFLMNRKPVVMYSWNDKTREEGLRREVVTAVNIYTDGTERNIFHQSGILEAVPYDILRVVPTEHTFIQVDYAEEPVFLNEIQDAETISAGYAYAGGINGGFFQLSGKEYGRPVGAVRRKNAWTQWQGEENTPAYGSGFATAYFTGPDMSLKYHGWHNGVWEGDEDWNYDNGYMIDAENGISGSYTYFADGTAQDITDGDKGIVDYRKFGRAATVFAQNENHEYLLIEIFGNVKDEKITEFLSSLNVINAIRMDGGISTQMVYVRRYVKEVR